MRKMFKKKASAVLAFVMILSLFSGISVNASVINTADEISDDFESFVDKNDGTWTEKYRLLNGNGGSISIDNLRANSIEIAGRGKAVEFSTVPNGSRASLKLGMVEENESIPGWWGANRVASNFSCSNDDIIRMSYEICVPDWMDDTTQGTQIYVDASYKDLYPAFMVVVKGATPKVYFTTRGAGDAGNTDSDTGKTLTIGKWHKFDLFYEVSTGKVKMYMDGEHIKTSEGKDEFETKMALDTKITNFEFGWAASSVLNSIESAEDKVKKGVVYFDNVSLTKVKESRPVWYADEDVEVGTTALKVDFDETISSDDAADIGDKIKVERFDTTTDKMLVGESAVLQSGSDYNIPDDEYISVPTVLDSSVSVSMLDRGISPSGVKLNLSAAIASNQAVKVTIPNVKTVTGDVVDIIKVYYSKPTAEEVVIVSEDFDDVTDGSNLQIAENLSELQTKVAAPEWVLSNKYSGKALKDVVENGKLKLAITDGAGVTTQATAALKNINLDPTKIEKLVVEGDFKHDKLTKTDYAAGQTSGNRQVASELTLTGEFDVWKSSEYKKAEEPVARVQFCQHVDNDKIVMQNFGGASTLATLSDSSNEYKNAMKDKSADFAEESKIEMEYIFGQDTYKVIHKVNGVKIGEKTEITDETKHARRNVFSITNITVNNRLNRLAESAVYADNIKMTAYVKPGSGVKNIIFEDENGNVLPANDGKIPAGAKVIKIAFNGVENVSSSNLSFSDNFSGNFANGIYTMTLDDVLVENTDYSLSIDEACSGIKGGYVQEFTTGTGKTEIGDIVFTDSTGENELGELPGAGNEAYAKVKAKNSTLDNVDGKLIVQLFEYNTEKQTDIVTEVYITDVDIESGYCGNITSDAILVKNDTTKVRVMLWDGYNTMNILSPIAELKK